MFKHTNAASRLYSIFSRAQASSSNAVYLAWAETFGLSTEKGHWVQMDVMEHLMWLKEDINVVRAGMRAKEFSEAIYEPALQQLESAIQPMALANGWKEHMNSSLRPEVMVILAACVEILPDEEVAIPEEDLAAIRSLASELEALIAVSDLPPQLRAMVQRQLDAFYKALEKYPVTGARAFRDASWMASGEMLHAQNDPNLKTEEFFKKPEFAKLDALWKRINAVVDGVIKIGGLYELGKTTYTLIGKASGDQ